ncbi:hypothetical protein B0H65DRAFT_584417 [Neurospora tetraspora]|uniref:Uncharacterized protein n=1 Tax=Neurospora tetraspora TaxID=94610 RepID=A0AAE0JNM3_9PEZI|nr:hypothetical protein B0H65DRAFT_584417 [Neurospora tetraspora]
MPPSESSSESRAESIPYRASLFLGLSGLSAVYLAPLLPSLRAQATANMPQTEMLQTDQDTNEEEKLFLLQDGEKKIEVATSVAEVLRRQAAERAYGSPAASESANVVVVEFQPSSPKSPSRPWGQATQGTAAAPDVRPSVEVPMSTSLEAAMMLPPQVPSETAEESQKVFTVAHPNVPEAMIRIQTDAFTPREALVGACKQLVAMYGQVGREFQKELALRQYADQGDNDNVVHVGSFGCSDILRRSRPAKRARLRGPLGVHKLQPPAGTPLLVPELKG